MTTQRETTNRFKKLNNNFTRDSVQIGDLGSSQMADVFNNLVSVSVDYSIDESSQLTIELIDPRFRMSDNGYFEIGRDIRWKVPFAGFNGINNLSVIDSPSNDQIEAATKTLDLTYPFEIASVTIDNGPGVSPKVLIEARPKAIQQMKRDRNPKKIKGNGSEYVFNAATKYLLKYVGQRSSKKKVVNTASGTRQADSVWDVLKNLAQEAEFALFEVDGVMVFAQEKFLIGKWGMSWDGPETGAAITDSENYKFIPLDFPSPQNSPFQVLQLPNIRRSDQDPYEGTGSAIIGRKHGTMLRPGMTILILGHPFGDRFLITRVSYKENSVDPVTIEFRTPVKTEKDLKNRIQLAVGKPASVDEAPRAPLITSRESLNPTPSTAFDPQAVDGILLQQLPSETQPFNYPQNSLDSRVPVYVEKGNINLWTRPIYKKTDGGIATLESFVYTDSPDWVLLSRVWCDGNNVDLLSQAEAITKYENDNLHLGKFSSASNANSYKYHLDRHQIATLKKRFPNNWWNIIGGRIPFSLGCPG